MANLIIAPSAENDLNAIVDYISKNGYILVYRIEDNGEVVRVLQNEYQDRFGRADGR